MSDFVCLPLITVLEALDFKNDPYNLTGKLLRNKKYLKGQKGTGVENQLRAKNVI